MNRSIRFVIVVVVLLVIAGAVFVILLRELETAGVKEQDVVLENSKALQLDPVVFERK